MNKQRGHFMKIKKLFTILTALCFSALAGVVFLKSVDNKKNARDIALANVESLANAEGDTGNNDNSSTTVKKCVMPNDFTENSNMGTYYLICYSETLGDRAYRCPPRTTEGRRNELHEYLHCTI